MSDTGRKDGRLAGFLAILRYGSAPEDAESRPESFAFAPQSESCAVPARGRETFDDTFWRADRRAPMQRRPLALHPLFPGFVALWFAALFGLGVGVLPTIALETLAGRTGLASVLPAAQAPLGLTARIALALAAALAGAVLGLALARQVVKAHRAPAPKADRPARESERKTARTRRRTARAADPTDPLAQPKPISAIAELGSEGLGPIDPEPSLARESTPTPATAEVDTIEAVENEAGDTRPDRARAEATATPPATVPQPAETTVTPVQPEPVLTVRPNENDNDRGDGASLAGLVARAQSVAGQPPAPERPLAEHSIAALVERFARALQAHEPAAHQSEDAPVLAALTAALDRTGRDGDGGETPPPPQRAATASGTDTDTDTGTDADTGTEWAGARARPVFLAASQDAPLPRGAAARAASGEPAHGTDAALRRALGQLERLSAVGR